MLPNCPLSALVAWANYATGVNPGKHGIFGFVDRKPNSLYRGHIPTAKDPQDVLTIWEVLSNAQGKRVGVINVPLTYPAQVR